MTLAGRALRKRDSRLVLQADDNFYSGHLKLRARLKDDSGASFSGYVGKATVTIGHKGGVMLTIERGAIGYNRSRSGLRPSHAWTFGIKEGKVMRHDTSSAHDVPLALADLEATAR